MIYFWNKAIFAMLSVYKCFWTIILKLTIIYRRILNHFSISLIWKTGNLDFFNSKFHINLGNCSNILQHITLWKSFLMSHRLWCQMRSNEHVSSWCYRSDLGTSLFAFLRTWNLGISCLYPGSFIYFYDTSMGVHEAPCFLTSYREPLYYQPNPCTEPLYYKPNPIKGVYIINITPIESPNIITLTSQTGPLYYQHNPHTGPLNHQPNIPYRALKLT